MGIAGEEHRAAVSLDHQFKMGNRLHKTWRLLVVDDHPLIRIGLEQIIRHDATLLLCGHATSMAGARAAVAEHCPDLVVVDLGLPDGDGLELLRELKRSFPGVRLLVLSELDEMLYGERAVEAGADGYLAKTASPERILVAIHAVLAGEIHVSRRVALLALSRIPGFPVPPPDNPMRQLSDRELYVLQLLGCRQSTRQVAARLGISHKTVQAHRENIKRKLKLADSRKLIEFAIGLVEGQTLPLPPASMAPEAASNAPQQEI
jgi:DNA-binding NarL/FixJ family response regulator